MSKKLYIILLILILGALSLTGCPGQKPTDASLSPMDYFPLPEGALWTYAGEGNEFAAFSRQVVAVEDSLAQVQEDTGGAVGTAIFSSTAEEIVRIFWEGEQSGLEIGITAEPNDNTIIIKAPIELGQKWNNQGHSREIVGLNEVVETPAGRFENCLKLEIIFPQSKIYEYYQPGVGLVKREFISEGFTVTSSLAEYSLE